MSESMILSIYIVANNLASSVFRTLGMDIAGMNGITGMATAAAVGLGAAVVGVGVASSKLASDFQTQFARITGLTGTSADMAEWYKQKILELSPTWDMTATSAAKALYFIISAGFSGQAAIDVLNYSAKSATASLADQATVADTLTSMMNAYKDANIGAAEAANDLTKIEVYGKATLSAFASSLGFTMVTAHAAGISMTEASAAIADLSQVSGQHGVRRMSLEFDNLARSLLDINAIAKRAKAEGLNFDANAFSTMTFIQKLQYLQSITGALSHNINDQTYQQMVNMDATTNQLQATQKLDTELDKSNSNFMKLTGGAAAFIPAVVLLSGKANEYNYILGKMSDKTDIVTSAFNNMRNTVGQQMKMFEIRLQNVGIVIGLYLLPYLSMLLKGLMEVAGAMLGWIRVPAHFALVASAVKGLAIILGAMLLPVIVHLVIASLPFLAMLAAMVVAAIAVGKATDFVVAHWKQFTSFLAGNTWQALAVKSVLIALGAILLWLAATAIVAAIDGLIAMIPWILLSTAMLWGMASAVIAATWPFVLAGLAIAAFVFALLMLITHWKQVAAFLVSVWNNILVTARNIWGAISDFFVGWWTKLSTGFRLAWEEIIGWLVSAWNAIIAAVTQFALDFVNALLWLYNHNYYVKSFVDSIVKFVQFMAVAVTTFVRDTVFAVLIVWNVLRTATITVWNAIVAAALIAWHLIQTYIITPVVLAYTLVVAALTKLWNWLVGIWTTIVADAKVAWQAFYNAVIAPVLQLWTKIQDIFNQIKTNITTVVLGLVNEAEHWGENLIHMFLSGIQKAAGDLWNGVKDVAKGITGILGFHSPPPDPSSPLHDAHTYMPNMMRMFATGITSGTPALALAAQNAAAVLANSLSGINGSSAAGSTASLAGAGLAGGGNVTHNWNVSFPNATDKREIKLALEDLQRDQQRLGRVGGYAGGLRKH